ncbi:MAG: 50S ribosomal protein L17 [Deltaproteobacteria bacterium 13_1_20CM_2_69_21]|nr:MAG: 50S ribosomal protein L17 [Deltaproteobacteria bacterium 13_1_40CM_68_24]OLD10006.1 MAG: 50S ribosomal protein L17 [Deltaproteobacteria bacterium 13_1_40CM_3_69_14]OLE64214.1 MAG: 50S ribosomal protein L17 [Deltaproteobacteria bacterium 13_1_20CM_2_69_21]
MSRHANTGRKLSRNTSHRKALLDNLVRAVILNESIRTTTPKAKEARRLVERVITKARENTLASRRVVHKTVRDQAALAKLFQSIGPRFKERPGGYTRLVHVENRVGDNAPMAILELVEKSEKAEPDKKPASEKKAAAKETGDQGAGDKKSAKQKKGKKEQEEKE